MKLTENYYLAELKSEEDVFHEGHAMKNCLARKDSFYHEALSENKIRLFSIRSVKNNESHITIELNVERNAIVQVQGKSNGPIKEKYRALTSFALRKGITKKLFHSVLPSIKEQIGIIEWNSKLFDRNKVTSDIFFYFNDLPMEMKKQLLLSKKGSALHHNKNHFRRYWKIILQSPFTSREIVDLALNHRSWKKRAAAIEFSPLIKVKDLDVALHDRDYRVRRAVATHFKLERRHIDKSAFDSSTSVKRSLIFSQEKKLQEDHVAAILKLNKNKTNVKHTFIYVKTIMNKFQKLLSETLFFNEPSWKARETIASCELLSSEDLNRAFEIEKNVNVLMQIVSNTNTSDELLRKGLTHHNHKIRLFAIFGLFKFYRNLEFLSKFSPLLMNIAINDQSKHCRKEAFELLEIILGENSYGSM